MTSVAEDVVVAAELCVIMDDRIGLDISLAAPTPRRYAEYQFCSRRGLCDFNTGRCECVDGFSRANCDVSESLITEDFDADVLELYTTLADFTGKGFTYASSSKFPRSFSEHFLSSFFLG